MYWSKIIYVVYNYYTSTQHYSPRALACTVYFIACWAVCCTTLCLCHMLHCLLSMPCVIYATCHGMCWAMCHLHHMLSAQCVVAMLLIPCIVVCVVPCVTCTVCHLHNMSWPHCLYYALWRVVVIIPASAKNIPIKERGTRVSPSDMTKEEKRKKGIYCCIKEERHSHGEGTFTL